MTGLSTSDRGRYAIWSVVTVVLAVLTGIRWGGAFDSVWVGVGAAILALAAAVWVVLPDDQFGCEDEHALTEGTPTFSIFDEDERSFGPFTSAEEAHLVAGGLWPGGMEYGMVAVIGDTERLVGYFDVGNPDG